ncbi:MAG: SDR family oxidoreductase [Sphingomonadales bacterium]|nr:SDR family oxidoreductase [Pseudomonadota bacterium]MDE2597822.1 SDR family oxidoreductase [Sphingomonadales bacterium]
MTTELKPDLGSPGTAVVITGGASGLGFATARALAAVGRPVALWDLDATRAADAAARVTAEFGTRAIGLGVDVRDLAAIEAGAQATLAQLPNVGGLVHCAGIVDTDSLDGMTEESWDSGIAVHLRALPFLIKAFLPSLKAQPGSAIVATASINATLGNAVNPIYSAGKGGILSIVRSLADRLGRDGIRINSISPGQILTPMLQPSVDALPQGYFEKRILLERLGAPEEIGRAVRFLLSDEASYITAAELVVDGGNISSQR